MKLWLVIGIVFSVFAVIFLNVFYYYGSRQCQLLDVDEPVAGQPGLLCLYRFPPSAGEILIFASGGFLFGSILGFLSSLALSKFPKKRD